MSDLSLALLKFAPASMSWLAYVEGLRNVSRELLGDSMPGSSSVVAILEPNEKAVRFGGEERARCSAAAAGVAPLALSFVGRDDSEGMGDSGSSSIALPEATC